MEFDIKNTITREEIEQAMKNYLAEGGRIQTLPSQKEWEHTYIGGDSWSPYENFDNLAIW